MNSQEEILNNIKKEAYDSIQSQLNPFIDQLIQMKLNE